MDPAMNASENEPSCFNAFDSLCGFFIGLAMFTLIAGGFLLLGSFWSLATLANNMPGSTLHEKGQSRALAATLAGFGITCFSTGVPLLIFSQGGRVILDVARTSRRQVQQIHEILAHLADLNPQYQERERTEEEAARKRVEAERERQAALAKEKQESERLASDRWAEMERKWALQVEESLRVHALRSQRAQEARTDAEREFDRILEKARLASKLSQRGEGIVGVSKAEKLADELCEDIDRLFAGLADVDQLLSICVTREIGDWFGKHPEFKSLNINLEPA
jgi:hypothetical protein